MTKTETAKRLLKRIFVTRDFYGRYDEYYEIDGKLDGEYKSWHRNGQLCFRCYYKDGQLDGEYKEWHDNGQLGVRSLYKCGERNGEYKYWNNHGELWNHWYYKDGVKIKA